MSNPSSPLYGQNGYDYEPGIRLFASVFPRDVVDRMKEFPMETGDVVIATYAKAGTTWMQEMTSQLHLQDDPEATKVNLSERIRHMELSLPGVAPEIDVILKSPHPHLMKTHLPTRIFQKQLSEGKGKFIVVMRNVKDNLVSFYHFHLANVSINCNETWDSFFEFFKAKQLMFGDWLDHNLSWWAYKDHPNVLIVKYEDMKNNRRGVIKKVAQFCEKSLSEETLDKITEATSFETMRDNPATNFRNVWHPHLMNFDISPFIRKGVVGDWKEYFNQEQNAFIEEHYLKEAAKHGLDFECTI